MKKKITFISAVIVCLLAFVHYLNNRITISVIVPAYNAEKYLERCLDSILSQSGSFKIIAVNDGSTDKTLQILQNYAKKHSNIEVIDQKNGGVSAARNAGLKAATTQYITFVDADDWLEPNAFEKVRIVLKQDNPDVILTGYYDVYNKEWVRIVKGEEYVNQVPEESRYPNRDLDKLALFSPFYGKDAYSDLFYASGGVRTRFFKKSFLEEHKIDFPEKITYNEDAVFMFRAFLNNPLISIVSSPLHNYRNRADSISKSENIIEAIPRSLAAMQNTAEFKQANRHTQMLINDSWLFLITLGIANLQRHHVSDEKALNEAYKAYKYMQSYNAEELKSCRNYIKLKELLLKRGFNLPL